MPRPVTDPLRPTPADRELAHDLLLGAVSYDTDAVAGAVVQMALLGDPWAVARMALATATLATAVFRVLAPNGPVASLAIREAHQHLVVLDRESGGGP
jgi:hypothetical protein